MNIMNQVMKKRSILKSLDQKNVKCYEMRLDLCRFALHEQHAVAINEIEDVGDVNGDEL